MTIYLVVLEDRHFDVKIQAFRTEAAAIERAEEIDEEYGYDDGKIYPSGWLFHAYLSGEGDSVHVEAVELED